VLFRFSVPPLHNGECLPHMALCHRRKRAATIFTYSLIISPVWLIREKVGPSAHNIASSASRMVGISSTHLRWPQEPSNAWL
jgi:hypothetical protein